MTVLALTFLLCLRGAGAETALERIKAKGELVIGTEAAYPPFEYMEGAQFRGFDIDLGNEIGKQLGVKVRWINIEWAGIFGALETGKFDLVMSGVTITEERKKERAFSRPYFLSGQTLARRTGDTRINSVKDLPGKIVAVQKETTGQKAALERGIPKSSLHEFDSLPDALLDVLNQKADVAIADEPALKDKLLKSHLALEIVGGVFVSENLGVVARKADTDLIAEVNLALDTIMVDGRYAQIYERHIQEPLTTAILGGLDRVRNQGTPVAERRRGGGAAPTASVTPPTQSAFTFRWDIMRAALPDLLRGARMTLFVTFLTLLIGVPAGLFIALLRLSSFVFKFELGGPEKVIVFAPVRWLATVYVEVVRGTPLLMQIYVIYFVLPAIGLRFEALSSAVTALSLNAAAYISEIFRAGIQSIDSGQMEAARALGMDYRAAMRWVILPQTLRRVLPPLTNEAVALLKDSSLVSIVALSELMLYGKQHAANGGSTITIYLTVALLYLAMTLPLTYLVRRLETKWQPISSPRARKQGRLAALASGFQRG